MTEVVVKVAHWFEIENHLRSKLEATYSQMDQAASVEILWRMQERAKVLRELLKLPEVLSLIENN